MSSAVLEVQYASGNGWQAAISLGRITLSVDPDVDDALVDAIEQLMSPPMRRYWTVRHLHENELNGWDVYVCDTIGTAIVEDALIGMRF